MNWKCLSVYQVVEGIKPTLLELQKFETAPEDVELEGKNCRSVAVCIGDGDKSKCTFSFLYVCFTTNHMISSEGLMLCPYAERNDWS